jgi:hypothetical protein
VKTHVEVVDLYLKLTTVLAKILRYIVRRDELMYSLLYSGATRIPVLEMQWNLDQHLYDDMVLSCIQNEMWLDNE